MRPALASRLKTFADDESLVLHGAREAAQLFVYDERMLRRYLCLDVWAPTGTTVLWVMFNPGLGETEDRRRPTLERCRRWSQSRGHGALLFCNLHPLRTRSAREVPPSEAFDDPLNLRAMELATQLADEVFVAWGAAVGRREIPPAWLSLLSGAYCLGVTRRGQPRHPLYVAAQTRPQIWRP